MTISNISKKGNLPYILHKEEGQKLFLLIHMKLVLY